jgi:hypothetical protein
MTDGTARGSTQPEGLAEPEGRAKPTVEALGIDLSVQPWQRSGTADGAIEVALVDRADASEPEWILMRVCGDPTGRVLVYDRNEWECFLDGVRRGEFDDAAS